MFGWILFWGLSPIWAFPVTWVLFVFAMKLKQYRDEVGAKNVSLWIKLFGYPFVGLGLLLDSYYVNGLTMSILLWQPPRLKKVMGLPIVPERATSRLSRYYRRDDYLTREWTIDRWRVNVCRFICDTFLHPFDRNHCR